MAYSAAGYILGGHEQYLAESNAPSQKKNMDQDSFLTLLVAQLTHQDPMNPMEDTDMTGQLAQFSSLEQLTSINDGIGNLATGQNRTDMLNAVSFIGKNVKAKGYNVAIDDGTVSTIHYGVGEAVAGVKVNIYDGDGAIVRTVEIGAKQPGTYEFEWDGRNDKGTQLPDGTYSVGILGEDLNGKPVMIQTEVSGEVSGIVQENGQSYLRLKDGRYINFANVTEVVNTNEIDTGSDTDSDTDSETDTDA
ncbi:flagellar hook assembly protein FlgD [Pseudodesulfovibrio senegalensis]|uniref:Basal-body rod modification protein FlgD n=1 Tax=Pseudodesulfovibrio senegalensis TaxID=1721087 RepID=A0A6N6MYI6_9BACT|nr:flagellar hook assembly protein FlgD [Pseudodesulfovibrio senegalensis]KAB1438975.1 flagellar hook assembly protein FlgD [Pseudodesulfovibrio senegalensis]